MSYTLIHPPRRMNCCAECGLHAEEALRCTSCVDHFYCSDACASRGWPEHLAQEHSERVPELSCILPSSSEQGALWVGSLRGLRNLSANRIDAVLTLLSPAYYEDETDAALARQVGDRPHMTFRLHDDEDANISLYFDKGCKFIQRHRDAGHNVLVHCHAGISRSVTMCLCYMVRVGAAPDWRTALGMVRDVRPIANPNPGFRAQLDRYCG